MTGVQTCALPIYDNTLIGYSGNGYNCKLMYQEFDDKSDYGYSPISKVRINNNGIGNNCGFGYGGQTAKQFPCIGFETNDITNSWWTKAISPLTTTVKTPGFPQENSRFFSAQSAVKTVETSGATIRYTTMGLPAIAVFDLSGRSATRLSFSRPAPGVYAFVNK